MRLHIKSIRCTGQAEQFFDYLVILAGDYTDRKNNHIQFMLLNRSCCRIFNHQIEVFIYRIFFNFTWNSTDIHYSCFFAAHKKIFESLAKSPNIHIKDFYFNVRVVILQKQTVLYSIHTADVAAIWIPSFRILGSRSNTLDKSNSFWRLVIGGSNEVTFARSFGADQSLKFHAGNNVLKSGVAIIV